MAIIFALGLFTSVFLLTSSPAAQAEAVQLAWDANTEPDIAGYNVYYSTVSRSVSGGYSQNPPIEVGDLSNPTCTLLLEAGKTYYIAVTAIDTSNNESDYSVELKRSGYLDVLADNWAYNFVMAISDGGITQGCHSDDLATPENEAQFCPDAPITRGQMAVFIETSLGNPPNTCTGLFGDVPTDHPFCGFIERMVDDGFTGGCGGNAFCPNDPVTRGQMAVFIEAALGHIPDICSNQFVDVPGTHPFCGFIERLADDGITGGCGGNNFCPDLPVTRSQMAVFLIAAPDPLFP